MLGVKDIPATVPAACFVLPCHSPSGTAGTKHLQVALVMGFYHSNRVLTLQILKLLGEYDDSFSQIQTFGTLEHRHKSKGQIQKGMDQGSGSIFKNILLGS